MGDREHPSIQYQPCCLLSKDGCPTSSVVIAVICRAHSSRAALLPVAGDAVAQRAKAGQLFHVDVDHVAWRLTFVALDRRFGLQVELDWFFWTGPIVNV